MAERQIRFRCCTLRPPKGIGRVPERDTADTSRHQQLFFCSDYRFVLTEPAVPDPCQRKGQELNGSAVSAVDRVTTANHQHEGPSQSQDHRSDER